MILEKIKLSEKYCDVKNGVLTIYCPDSIKYLDSPKKHTILVCPGGAYGMCSQREGEVVALKLIGFGFNVAVLNYSTFLGCYPYPMNEVEASLDYLEKNYERFNIKDISLMGFSAGGHLASYCAYTTKHKIASVILGYPVITMNEYTHSGTRKNLMHNCSENMEKELSVENLVTADSPRTFIYTTVNDDAVPFENTLFLVQALRKNKVSFELHAFEKGPHGISLANDLIGTDENYINTDIQKWLDLAVSFIKR